MQKNRNREITKLLNAPPLTDALIIALSDLCFYHTPITACEVLFVFGSNIMHTEIGHKINILLQEHAIPKVIITGGIADYGSSIYEPYPESELIFANIEKEKFPKTTFIIENTSKNTLENVSFSEVHLQSDTIQKISFVSHAYASRRCLLSLQKYLPHAQFANLHIDIPSDTTSITVSATNWFKTDTGKKTVWGEYVRLKTYGSRGDFPITDILDKLAIIETIIDKTN